MRKLFVLLAAAIVFSTVAFGQESPKGEVFAGYSYMRSNLQNFGLDNANLNGATLQGTAYLRNNIGITADITRVNATNVEQSGEDVTRYTYLFGPTYALRNRSAVTPYVHVLFGADHERLSISNFGDFYDTSFATVIGGGVDVKLADHVAFRPVQMDYIHTNHSGGEDHFRYSTGLVLRF